VEDATLVVHVHSSTYAHANALIPRLRLVLPEAYTNRSSLHSCIAYQTANGKKAWDITRQEGVARPRRHYQGGMINIHGSRGIPHIYVYTNHVSEGEGMVAYSCHECTISSRGLLCPSPVVSFSLAFFVLLARTSQIFTPGNNKHRHTHSLPLTIPETQPATMGPCGSCNCCNGACSGSCSCKSCGVCIDLTYHTSFLSVCTRNHRHG
jgi:hypothetical protein